ncbi:MAG TPA: alanine dehydrogenase [Casimicrobiaceae bacterium]|jgi:alanine dehydrogenase
MRIGVPREIKDGERRVGLLPDGVRALVDAGHDVLVERSAGLAVGFDDATYAHGGATLVDDVLDVWRCELIVKVKELQPPEYPLLVRGTTIFGYAQLARDPHLLDAVLRTGVRIIAYELVRDASGALPLLMPMSRIAGRLAPFAGAQSLYTDRGGSGVLLTGVDGVAGANVVVVGAGTAGGEAAHIAARLGCRVTVVSRGVTRLNALDTALAKVGTPVATSTIEQMGPDGFAEVISAADLVIAAVLDPGKLSPRLITREHLRSMRPGSAFVDIGIDQGGIAETSRMTTISHPTYVEERVVHYAVPNMPSLVARTATEALTAATLPYVMRIAGRGIVRALTGDHGLAQSVLVEDGAIVHSGLAADRR